jgi:hypothetical protein
LQVAIAVLNVGRQGEEQDAVKSQLEIAFPNSYNFFFILQHSFKVNSRKSTDGKLTQQKEKRRG